jgi:hypothetical protein
MREVGRLLVMVAVHRHIDQVQIPLLIRHPAGQFIDRASVLPGEP